MWRAAVREGVEGWKTRDVLAEDANSKTLHNSLTKFRSLHPRRCVSILRRGLRVTDEGFGMR